MTSETSNYKYSVKCGYSTVGTKMTFLTDKFPSEPGIYSGVLVIEPTDKNLPPKSLMNILRRLHADYTKAYKKAYTFDPIAGKRSQHHQDYLEKKKAFFDALGSYDNPWADTQIRD